MAKHNPASPTAARDAAQFEAAMQTPSFAYAYQRRIPEPRAAATENRT